MMKSFQWHVLAMVAAVTVLSGNSVVAQEEKWVSLFDGKTLEGWEKVGNDKSNWEVKDGALA